MSSRQAQAKLVLLGESSVGKSSLIHRFTSGSFDQYKESTIGSAFLTKVYEIDLQHTIKFEIWDTAGQERYKSLAPMYYRNADVALVVFDITDPVSFRRAKNWILELELQAPEGIIIKLVGNKCDLEDINVDESSVKALITEHPGVEYAETSAKTGQGVEELFSKIAEQIPGDKFDQIRQETIDLSLGPKNGACAC